MTVYTPIAAITPSAADKAAALAAGQDLVGFLATALESAADLLYMCKQMQATLNSAGLSGGTTYTALTPIVANLA